jgi:hypothetical protein
MSLLNFDDANIDHIYKELRRNLDEIKARQYVGAESVAISFVETGASSDRSATLPAGGKAVFSISFISTQQSYAFASLSFRLYVDSIGAEVFPGDVLYPDINVRQNVINPATPNVNSWTIEFYNFSASTHTYFLKAYIQSTDTGGIS